MIALLHSFTADAKVTALAILVALDLVLGVTVALHAGAFRLRCLTDFLRDDVLGKLVPYFALWAAVHVGGDVALPGTSLGVIADGAFAIVALALGASVLGSLKDLGLVKPPDVVS